MSTPTGKTRGRPRSQPVEELKTKPVRLDLSPEVHHKLRVVAAEEGKAMAEFARDLVEQTVTKLYGVKRG